MATLSTFTTPEEGWQFFSHFIGNCLLVFALAVPETQLSTEESEAVEQARCDAWVKLVGSLSYIAARARALGHGQDANKMLTITEVAAQGDLRDPAIREVIQDLHTNLSPLTKDVDAAVERLFGRRST
jgi:hypothetical protein